MDIRTAGPLQLRESEDFFRIDSLFGSCRSVLFDFRCTVWRFVRPLFSVSTFSVKARAASCGELLLSFDAFAEIGPQTEKMHSPHSLSISVKSQGARIAWLHNTPAHFLLLWTPFESHCNICHRQEQCEIACVYFLKLHSNDVRARLTTARLTRGAKK